MAMLASKAPFSAGLSASPAVPGSAPQTAGLPGTARRVVTPGGGGGGGGGSQSFPSPTESDFSDASGPDSVKHWDEDRVADYLRSINCGEYEKLFRKNHINGENLLELDKEVLQEIGIEKVGDRVRLFLGIKKLRMKAYANQKKRNRDSFAGLLAQSALPSSEPSRQASTRSLPTPAMNKRYSRQIDPFAPLETARQQRFPAGSGFVPSSSRLPASASDGPVGRVAAAHTRNNSSMDGSLMAALPQNQDVIRVISTGGVTKVVKIAGCNTCEDVMRVTLRKFALREDHERNYCFWVLAGIDPDPSQCRRLGDTELWRIIKDQRRPERNRLILRRVPAAEPGEAELQRAAAIALEEEQQKHAKALESVDKRSLNKVQKLLGEKWNDQLQQPLSPVSFQDRERTISQAAKDLERPSTADSSRRPQQRRKVGLRQFGGLRPPSELIASDLTSYFPDHPREDIDRTARLSMRRSSRLSKVNSRLSVASNLSVASSFQDAPPIPTIADAWLNGGSAHVAKVRASRDRLAPVYGRDSIASSMLDTLQEESSSSSAAAQHEPDRKSYVSFTTTESGSDTAGAALSVTDPEGNTRRSGLYAGSLQEALTHDGEEADEELQSFLAGESWDDNKWMKGALIGQGSFGSVYLALHAVTGELLAVKQVETPAPGANSQSDTRKKSMIDALKREISLLRELRHPNIVQYLGCSSSADQLNIFLEYVPGGSVQTMLNSYGALPEPLVRSFVRQILTGLSYLHDRDIIHRDIKGANILTSYTRKADIWSLGCLVVEMMTGNHPFPDCSQLQAIFKIGGGKAAPTVPENASLEAQAFLRQTFEIDHKLRPSADELMRSPFLAPLT
ncbi:hypothetical protein CP532_0970 [Ophiocordyceps camponoti-leonardi (nom. inval.)]|nr:hypothetical protein CP532_0970 [Ophiocordyceps camponoti-leonardi (nom. inval.)]